MTAMSEPNSRLSASLGKSLAAGDKKLIEAELASYRAEVDKQLDLYKLTDPSPEFIALQDGMKEYLLWLRNESAPRVYEAFEKGSTEPTGSERQRVIISNLLTPLGAKEDTYIKRLNQLALAAAAAGDARAVSPRKSGPEDTAMYHLGRQLATLVLILLMVGVGVMLLVKRAKTNSGTRAHHSARRQAQRSVRESDDPY